MIVMKFGGTSVASAERINAAAEQVQKRLPQHPVVVVSALGGVTDLLLSGAKLALERDTLVMFTDGACDTLSPEGEDFGEPRLRELLRQNCCNSAGELLERLDTALDEFRLDMPRVDDVTLLAIRRSQ